MILHLWTYETSDYSILSVLIVQDCCNFRIAALWNWFIFWSITIFFLAIHFSIIFPQVSFVGLFLLPLIFFFFQRKKKRKRAVEKREWKEKDWKGKEVKRRKKRNKEGKKGREGRREERRKERIGGRDDLEY